MKILIEIADPTEMFEVKDIEARGLENLVIHDLKESLAYDGDFIILKIEVVHE